MKNLLLPIVALCSLMMSCTNNSEQDPQPSSPYAITASGQSLLTGIKLLSLDAEEQFTITDLQDCKIVICDGTYTALEPIPNATFEYKNGSAAIDMDKATVKAIRPIEEYFKYYDDVVITNKAAKYITATPVAVDAKGEIITPLLLSNVDIKTMKATLVSQWYYLTQATRVTAKFTLNMIDGPLEVDLDLDFRQGWNAMMSHHDYAKSQLILRANDLPASGLLWTNEDIDISL